MADEFGFVRFEKATKAFTVKNMELTDIEQNKKIVFSFALPETTRVTYDNYRSYPRFDQLNTQTFLNALLYYTQLQLKEIGLSPDDKNRVLWAMSQAYKNPKVAGDVYDETIPEFIRFKADIIRYVIYIDTEETRRKEKM